MSESLLGMKFISFAPDHCLSHFSRSLMQITWEKGMYVPDFLVGYTARYPSPWHAMLACTALNEHSAEMCEDTEGLASMRRLARFPVVGADGTYEMRDIREEIEARWGADSVGAVAYLVYKLPAEVVKTHFDLDFMTENCSRMDAQAVQSKVPRLLGCMVHFWKPILCAKFDQYPDLRRRLLEDAGGSLTTIVFEMKGDDFWGGLVARPGGRSSYLDGENMMGNLLTDFRDSLLSTVGSTGKRRADDGADNRVDERGLKK